MRHLLQYAAAVPLKTSSESVILAYPGKSAKRLLFKIVKKIEKINLSLCCRLCSGSM